MVREHGNHFFMIHVARKLGLIPKHATDTETLDQHFAVWWKLQMEMAAMEPCEIYLAISGKNQRGLYYDRRDIKRR